MAKDEKEQMLGQWTAECVEALQARNNLSRDDLEYVVTQVAKLKDERLQSCIATLIGWGDDDRATLETFCAISLEVMKKTPSWKIREAAKKVELRVRLKDINGAIKND